MHSVFHPMSPQAHMIAALGGWMTVVGGTIWILVVGVAVIVAVRNRAVSLAEAGPAIEADADRHRRAERVVIAAVVLTVVILLGFLGYDFAVGRALAEKPERGITIDVTGHQWWWEFTYDDPNPSRRFTTANEIHIPVGQPIQLQLESRDVIHSFWLPSVHGKRDLIPGYTATFWIQADTPGVYRGFCAEFCGHQHAKMAMLVVAEPAAAFTRWAEAARGAAPAPTTPEMVAGQKVFLSRSCALCHTIGGTEARGTVGPDLTHLASRSTIAGGSVPNTAGYLGGWIVDPQSIKPGVRMPSTPLTSTELRSLLAYLESLK